MSTRSDGQKSVIIMMREEFVDEIDACFEKEGYADRSSFIRDSVYAELIRLGVKIPPSYKSAPSRKGKGGRPSEKVKGPVKSYGLKRGEIQNEKSNRKPNTG